jgi:hypothetical protein
VRLGSPRLPNPVTLPGAPRPRWLTTGALHLLVLCALIVAIGMVRPRLSPHSAAIVVAVASAAVVAGALGFLGATRRLASHLPLPQGSERVAGAVLLLLRRTGLPLLGLAFFLVWTFVYLTLWAIHPHQTFAGIGRSPRFADFFYYAVSTAFISPPGDILAHSRGARSATMIEMLTGFALLTTYLASFVDWGRGRPPEPRED